jgi:hypothetical protein
MTIRADSYSSTSEVKAFTRHLLDGQTAFNSTTKPTVTEIEKYIDRASAALNIALKGVGLTTPIYSTTNSTASLLCDDWVTARVVEYAELTKRGQGYGGEENKNKVAPKGLYALANDFAKESLPGLRNMGISQTVKLSDGLTFTGLDAQGERADPDNADREQPIFSRRQFENEGDKE